MDFSLGSEEETLRLEIAVAQRKNAHSNPQALLRDSMTIADYLNSRMISDPIRSGFLTAC